MIELDRKNIVVTRDGPIGAERRRAAIMHRIVATQLRERRPQVSSWYSLGSLTSIDIGARCSVSAWAIARSLPRCRYLARDSIGRDRAPAKPRKGSPGFAPPNSRNEVPLDRQAGGIHKLRLSMQAQKD